MMKVASTELPPSEQADKSRFIQSLLGALGLLPFYLCLLASWDIITDFGQEPKAVFINYSLVIFAFLCGTLWGRAQLLSKRDHVRVLFVASNIIVLIAWGTFSFTNFSVSLIIFSIAYMLLLLLEGKLASGIDNHYLGLRILLTLGVVLAHLIMYFSL